MVSTKRIFEITYPVFLTLLAQNIINVTDTAFLGRVSEIALGASAIGGVFYIAIYFIGFGFSQGAQILIGRRNGEQKYHEIGQIFYNALIFNVALAVFVLLSSLLFMPDLLRYLVSSDAVYQATTEYLNWRIFGFLFAFVSVVFRAFYVGITRTKVLTVAGVVTAVTNVVFDYMLIFGNFGCPELGIAGAGIASVLAELATMIYLIVITLRQKDREVFRLFSIVKVGFGTIQKILSLSIFIMFQFFISISTWFLFFIFIERLGERPLAITNIGRSLYVLLMIPGSALSTTANTLVSNMIGEGHKQDVIPFMNKVIRVVLLVVAPLMLLTFIFPELFARVYTDNPDLIQASLPTLRIVSIAMVFCAVGNIIFNTISGTGNTKSSFLIELITLFFYAVYIYYTAVVLHTTVEIVWMSEFVYWILIGTMGYLYLRFGKWRKKVI